MRADGSGLTRITDEKDVARIGAQNVYSPSVSPDGRTLAVQTDRSAALVYLDRPPGRRIEPIPILLSNAKWSPDGKKIVGTDSTRTPAGIRGGIVVYSIPERRFERVSESGNAPQWLGDGRKLVIFEPEDIRVLDLESRQTTSARLESPPGVQYDLTYFVRISHEGSTIYFVTALEQGDIWMVRFAKD